MAGLAFAQHDSTYPCDMPAGSRRLLRLALGLVVVLFAWLALPAPATAHSYLNDSDPADGAALKQAPKQVTLTFSDGVRDTGLGVTADGPQGAFLLDSSANAKKVVANWPDDSAPGTYTVSYRAVSIDGHVMDGNISFQIATGDNLSSPATTATPELLDPTDSEAAENATTDPDKAPEGVPPWVFFLGALIAAGGIAAGVLRGRSEDK